MTRLKADIQVVKKKGLHYIAEEGIRSRRFRPWIGDSFSFLYDFFMRSSVFPRKFGADIRKHCEILSQELAGIHGKRVLELATGSGSAAHFLGSDNQYTGTDISPNLLKRAAKRFSEAGFSEPEFYVASAEDLPFESRIFDLCLCVLALNFFGSSEKVFQEVRRVLVPEGVFVCCVPVPERNKLRSTIGGTLLAEAELRKVCQESGFRFELLPAENGALLYFRAIKRS